MPLGLYDDIEYELALGEHNDALENTGERALALLESRFPGVREVAREIEQPPSLSRQAGDALHGTSCNRRPRRPARRFNHHVPRRVRRSRSWLFANARAHPVETVAMVTVSTIVIVHFWVYIAVAVLALAALKAAGALRRGERP